MDFSEALIYIKRGRRLARSGWNGRGMYIYLDMGGRVVSKEEMIILPHIMMKTVIEGEYVPWLASQTDLLAEDWEFVL